MAENVATETTTTRKTKTKKELKNARRWTETEINTFADVLSDSENSFCMALEMLALKKSANNEVFEHLQKKFVLEMQSEEFKTRNAEHFKGKATKLDMNIEKLRQKYKWLKQEWSAKTTRAQNGSGLDPDKEPYWYRVLNPVMAETHRPLDLTSSSMDTSFVSDFPNLSSESDVEQQEEASVEALNPDLSPDLDGDANTENNNDAPPIKKSKIVVAPHKKSQQIRSNKHGLSAIARGMTASITAQDKRFDRQFKENIAREKRMVAFRAAEAEKHRQHELKMAQLFMSAMSANRNSNMSNVPSPFGQQQQFSGGWLNSSSTSSTMTTGGSSTNPMGFPPPLSRQDQYHPVNNMGSPPSHQDPYQPQYHRFQTRTLIHIENTFLYLLCCFDKIVEY